MIPRPTSRPAPARRALALAAAASLTACAGAQRPATPAPPPPPPQADPAAVLAGCRSAQLTRTLWRVECGGLVAEVQDPYGEDEAALLEAGRAQVALVTGGVPSAQQVTLAVGGAYRPATRLALASTAAPARARGVGLLATVPFGEGRTRLTWCAGQAGLPPERCAQVVDALGGLPWRRGPAPAGALAPLLAGRPVLAPEGCEVAPHPLGGDVSCSASDGWRWRRVGLPRPVAPSDLEYADSAEEADQRPPAAAEPVPEPPADGRPCLVDGVATRCAVSEAWGGAMVTVATVATVRGQPLELTCSFFGAPDDLPPVCDGLEWAP